ncbi:glycosyltransferase [Flavobacteriaceae bacterium XHP0103]|uniref:glycosyltransferase n=1 Tax=Marixanthotalea marina TaxID=2844359 RepID=UPI002989BB5B|nr:glycosyltransferase [Marixanthotalea marina]MBU3822723.1 glycosyltransferase [Marixanthotalea marina]
MKVLQLIDSLHAGGAERVAINNANALCNRIDASYLCATREEGVLKDSLSQQVGYLFLNKKAALDFKAIYKLHKFVRKNVINIVHAHSSSFFVGTLLKLLNPKLVLIWHDHYGKSEFLDTRPKLFLKFCSRFFNHVFCVNTKLEAWNKKQLKTKSISYLSNFAVLIHKEKITKLKGKEGKRIVCLANLREQKDHITLIKAFEKVLKSTSGWTLHLVGKDFNDAYSKKVKAFIKQQYLEASVFLYGSCPDTLNILNQASIGVLSSKSEGLPLALLEYGLAGLPVVATKVGDCSKVISTAEEGMLVAPERDDLLAKSLIDLIGKTDLRIVMGQRLKSKVVNSFSEASVVEALITVYKKYQ